MSTYNGHVTAIRVAASTLAVTGLRDLLGVQYANAGTAGVLTFRDGGISAAVLLELSTPAAAGGNFIDLPGQGIRAHNGIYVDLGAGGTAVTIFVG